MERVWELITLLAAECDTLGVGLFGTLNRNEMRSYRTGNVLRRLHIYMHVFYTKELLYL